MRKWILAAIFLGSSLGAWGEQFGLAANGSFIIGPGGGGAGLGLSYLFANDTRLGHEVGVSFFHQEVHEFPIFINENDYLVLYHLVFGYSPETQAGFFWYWGGGSWVVNSIGGEPPWLADLATDIGCGWVYNQALEFRLNVPVVFESRDGRIDVGGGLIGSFGYRF